MTSVDVNAVPDQVLELIFTYVNLYKDWDNIHLVCKRWRRVAGEIHRRMKRLFYRCSDFAWNLIEEDPFFGHLLSERCSHACCYHPGMYSMYMFGGCTSTYTAFNDLWLFNLSERKWERVIITRLPLPSAKALSTLTLYGENLILFGGFSKSSMNPIHQTTTFYNELHLYNKKLNCWEEILCENTAPHLAGHSASVVNDFVLVFGGSMGSAYNNNLFVFDIHRRIWNMPSIPGPCPPPRYGHSQVVLDDHNLIIFGGCGGPNMMLDDVWLLHFDLKNSGGASGNINESNSGASVEWKWTQLKVQNPDSTPPYTWCHRATKVGRTSVVVVSRPNKFTIRRRRNATLAGFPASGSSSVANPSRSTGVQNSPHQSGRLSSPDSPQDRRAVAAAILLASTPSKMQVTTSDSVVDNHKNEDKKASSNVAEHGHKTTGTAGHHQPSTMSPATVPSINNGNENTSSASNCESSTATPQKQHHHDSVSAITGGAISAVPSHPSWTTTWRSLDNNDGRQQSYRQPMSTVLSSSAFRSASDSIGGCLPSFLSDSSSSTTFSPTSSTQQQPLHRAYSIPAIIVGEIPKLIVTSDPPLVAVSPSHPQHDSQRKEQSLFKVNPFQNHPMTHESPLSSATSFKSVQHEHCQQKDQHKGNNCNSNRNDKQKPGQNKIEQSFSSSSSPTLSSSDLMIRDYYMSLVREEYSRLRIVELTENLHDIDKRLDTFICDRLPYLLKQERSSMIVELLNEHRLDKAITEHTMGAVAC